MALGLPTGAAFADAHGGDDAAADPCASGDDMGANPCAGDDAAGADADPAAAVVDAAPAAATPYPQRALNRPRTLPGGAFQGAVRLIGAAEFEVFRGSVQALYSPVDKVQLAATYPFGLEPSAFDTGVTLAARHFTVAQKPHLYVGTQLTVPLNFSGGDVFTGVNIAPPTKYKINDMFGLFFGDGLLDVIVTPDFGMRANLPLEIGAQFNDNVFAKVGTKLATIKIAGDAVADSTFIGADNLPVAITGLYALNYMMDVVAVLNAGDVKADGYGFANMSFVVGVNYRGGFKN